MNHAKSNPLLFCHFHENKKKKIKIQLKKGTKTMQRKSFKRALCLLLTLLTVLPLIVATGMFTTSAATETYNVIGKSSGSIQYKGKNYATGAT